MLGHALARVHGHVSNSAEHLLELDEGQPVVLIAVLVLVPNRHLAENEALLDQFACYQYGAVLSCGPTFERAEHFVGHFNGELLVTILVPPRSLKHLKEAFTIVKDEFVEYRACSDDLPVSLDVGVRRDSPHICAKEEFNVIANTLFRVKIDFNKLNSCSKKEIKKLGPLQSTLESHGLIGTSRSDEAEL